MSPREYIVLRTSQVRRNNPYHLDRTSSDPYDDKLVKSIDEKLHRTLINISRKRHLTSGQIRKLLRAPEKLHTANNSIFELILKQEPRLGKLLFKRNELSLLWIVVLSNYEKSAELLVRSGADVNEVCGINSSSNKLTKESSILHALLQMYPSSWNEQFVNLIIEHGADLQARDSRMNTILHSAVRNGRVKVTEMLLEAGADVNAVSWGGITALFNAAETSEADKLVPLLIRYGADINARDHDGCNVLRYLTMAPADGEHADLARALIDRGVSPCETSSNRYQLIHLAAMRGKIELVNLFLDYGANVNELTDEGEFPLYLAARECEDPTMLLTLLSRGANIDQTGIFDFTVLFGLVMDLESNKNTLEIMKILLSFGSYMYAEDEYGNTLFDLICDENVDNQSVRLMIRTVALKEACMQQMINFEHMSTIRENMPVLWKYYRNCTEELIIIKSAKFFKNCSFFDLLTKCRCQIAPLMRNQEFEKQFRQFDRRVFPIFAKYILEAFKHAKNYYQSMMDQENLIDEAIGHILPYMILRKVADHTQNCEICELKKIVQSSRVYICK